MANIGDSLMKLGCGMTILVWVGLPMAVVVVVTVMAFPPLLIVPIGVFVVWLFGWNRRRYHHRVIQARAEHKYTTLQEGMTLEEACAIMGSKGETVKEFDGFLIVQWWYDGRLLITAAFTVGPGGPVLTYKRHDAVRGS